MAQIALALPKDNDVLSCVEQFKKITRYYALFNLIFLIVAFLEVFFFLLFFAFFAKSALLGVSIGCIFFTGFSYCVLLFYFQGKKPDQLLNLKENYIEQCKREIRSAPGTVEYHTFLVERFYQLAQALQKQEFHYYRLPWSLETLGPLLEKLSVWTYWKEVLQMKEMLLMDAVAHTVELVKKQPTDLQTHASLAQAYDALAQLYKDPEEGYPLSVFATQEMKQKFKRCMEKSLEEWKIVAHFTPENAWIHSQLAMTYQALQLPQKEIEEYEILRSLLPQDKDVLLRLGTLYLKQGHSALGLLVYEELKPLDQAYADTLITHYLT